LICESLIFQGRRRGAEEKRRKIPGFCKTAPFHYSEFSKPEGKDIWQPGACCNHNASLQPTKCKCQKLPLS